MGISKSLTLHGRVKSQIRSLHSIYDRRRARVPLGLVKLHVSTDRRGDVPNRLLLLLERRAGFRVVGRQRVGAAEVERAPAVGPRGRGADVDFLRGHGAVVAYLSCGDAEGFLAEHVALFVWGGKLAVGFFLTGCGERGFDGDWDLRRRCWLRRGC